jgi:outer membrane protein assembly factor BamB
MKLGRHTLSKTALVLSILAIGACDLIKSAQAPKLPGERISIMSFEKKIEADPRIQSVEVKLPKPYTNTNWTQPGGIASAALHHLSLGENPKSLWRTSMGEASYDSARIVASPIVSDGVLYFLDAVGNVAAMDANNGDSLWYKDLGLEEEEAEAAFGGGIAISEGRLVAANGLGFVVALDGKTGKEIWRSNIGVPFRSAPTISNGRIFVSTHDNQLHALALEDGGSLWSHQGISEGAGILGSTSPSVSGETVVVSYTSGELFALRVQNGRILWSDALTRTGRLTPLARISDIVGRVVIDRGMVFAVSHSGRMAAIDLRSGQRVWTRSIGGVQTPWVSGNYLFVLTSDSEVICLSRADGRVRWISPLENFEDMEDKEDPIEWSGPVLAGDRLILVSSLGEAIALSPYDGRALGSLEISSPASIAPIVVNNIVYFLTDAAEVVALR